MPDLDTMRNQFPRGWRPSKVFAKEHLHLCPRKQLLPCRLLVHLLAPDAVRNELRPLKLKIGQVTNEAEVSGVK